jgi:hypothetical protein
MNASTVESIVCSSHSFATPDASWAFDQLGQYAQSVDRAITEGERSLTPADWNLGLALELARRQFSYRQWGRFLAGLNVDPTRASKARAIHRTFQSADAVAELSVKEAYQRRKRRRRPRPRLPQMKHPVACAPDRPPAARGLATSLAQFFADIRSNLAANALALCNYSAWRINGSVCHSPRNDRAN